MNSQNLSRAYPQKPDCAVDVTYDIINLLQFEQFRQNLKQYLVAQIIGEFLGISAGTIYYKGWKLQGLEIDPAGEIRRGVWPGR